MDGGFLRDGVPAGESEIRGEAGRRTVRGGEIGDMLETTIQF